MNIRLLDIHPLEKDIAAGVPRPKNNPEFIYTAIAIEENLRFFYWAKGVNLELTFEEFKSVISNPKLFNDSISFKLHDRIQQQLLSKQ
jgi:hypothetical protein